MVIKKTGQAYAKEFVRFYGDRIVIGAGGDYTAKWILEEAEIRLKEGDVNE